MNFFNENVEEQKEDKNKTATLLMKIVNRMMEEPQRAYTAKELVDIIDYQLGEKKILSNLVFLGSGMSTYRPLNDIQASFVKIKDTKDTIKRYIEIKDDQEQKEISELEIITKVKRESLYKIIKRL